MTCFIADGYSPHTTPNKLHLPFLVFLHQCHITGHTVIVACPVYCVALQLTSLVSAQQPQQQPQIK